MPLFNIDPHLRSNHLSLEFDRLFVQGTVGRIQVVFPDTQEARIKYFVALNADSNEALVLSVLSQSNPQYALRHPILKTHLVKASPESSDGIFRKACYIDCTKIVPLKREKVLAEFIKNPSILVGRLPDPLLNEVIDVIVGSNLIEVGYQERIYCRPVQ